MSDGDFLDEKVLIWRDRSMRYDVARTEARQLREMIAKAMLRWKHHHMPEADVLDLLDYEYEEWREGRNSCDQD